MTAFRIPVFDAGNVEIYAGNHGADGEDVCWSHLAHIVLRRAERDVQVGLYAVCLQPIWWNPDLRSERRFWCRLHPEQVRVKLFREMEEDCRLHARIAFRIPRRTLRKGEIERPPHRLRLEQQRQHHAHICGRQQDTQAHAKLGGLAFRIPGSRIQRQKV